MFSSLKIGTRTLLTRSLTRRLRSPRDGSRMNQRLFLTLVSFEVVFTVSSAVIDSVSRR